MKISWLKSLLAVVAFVFSLAGNEKNALAVFQYCATYTPAYLDSNKGEDYLNAPAGGGMSYHYYEFWNSDETQLFMSGYFDSNGCVPGVTAQGTGKFRVFPKIRRGSGNGTIIRAKLLTANESMTFARFNLNAASSPGAAVVPFTLTMGNFMGDLFRATAVATAIPLSLLVLAQDWTIVTQANTDSECGGAGGCAKSDIVYLGHDQNGIWHNQRKSIVAHEIGHLVQENSFGYWSSTGAGFAGDYSDVASNTVFCSCWYVQSAGDRSHCMTSREYLTGAFQEGYAHFVASRALNNSAQGDAVYPYYKEVLVRASSQPPSCAQGGSCSFFVTPVAHDVVATHRWLETQCSTDTVSHRATEMDWLGLLYNLNVSYAYSGSDIQAIMLNSNTCGASCGDSDEVTWNELNLSVNAQSSFSGTKKLMFNDQSVAYGIKR